MLLEVLVPTALWERVRVQVGGEPLLVGLRQVEGTACVVAEWPRSGPGRYRVRIQVDGTSFDETITVAPSKISSEEFEALLGALETELPALVAVALKNAGALAGIELRELRPTTLAEELMRIRRAIFGQGGVRGLIDVLTELGTSPHVALRTTERWVNREHARRPAVARLAHAYARPGNIDCDGAPAQLIDARVEHTVDTYENRIVRSFVRQVERRLRRLDRSRPRLASDEASQLDHARAAFARAKRHASFLDQVSALRVPPARVTMVLLRRPPYPAALAGYLAFQRGYGVRLEDRALEAPLNSLPYLYQVWGTLHVILALLEAATGHGYRVVTERLIARDVDGCFVRALPAGCAAVELAHPTNGRVVRLIPERTYSVRKGQAGLRSVTFAQRPDIAVEMTQPGRRTHVYVFDPKYKLSETPGDANGVIGQPMKADVDKMHTYRDAIRDEMNRRVVRYAAILYPGTVELTRPGIGAISALPSSVSMLRGRLRRIFDVALSGPS